MSSLTANGTGTLDGPPQPRRGAVPLAICALAACAFVIGSTEFVVPGVLPEIAFNLHISITTAGLLVSGYALGVVIGAPLVTASVVRLPRKQVLLGLLVFCVAGNLVSGVAGSYDVLMGGRLLASLCHGAFFGIASVVAGDLVAPERRARAIAGMFMGITLANLVGVPSGVFVGQHLGWRVTFLFIAGGGVISIVGVAFLVPPSGESQRRLLRDELQAFKNAQVWLALAMTAFGFGAIYCPLTFIVALMTSTAGFPHSAVSWLLVLFGTGLTVGNVAGARSADQHLMATLCAVLAALVVVLLVFAETSHHEVGAAATLFLLGVFAYATVPGFTARVINSAGATGTTLASSAAVAAFNLGNAAGAYLGGVALTLGRHTNPPDTCLMGAAMAGLGLLVAGASVLLERHTRVSPGVAT